MDTPDLKLVQPCGVDLAPISPCPCLLPRGHEGQHRCKHTAK